MKDDAKSLGKTYTMECGFSRCSVFFAGGSGVSDYPGGLAEALTSCVARAGNALVSLALAHKPQPWRSSARSHLALAAQPEESHPYHMGCVVIA